jgi:hypothetical protein
MYKALHVYMIAVVKIIIQNKKMKECFFIFSFKRMLHELNMVADLEHFCASCSRYRQHDKAPKGALSDFRLVLSVTMRAKRRVVGLSSCHPVANDARQTARCRMACCRDVTFARLKSKDLLFVCI